MASLKALKIRIGSVKSTQKITKAMKMVAAAKLRRAQQRAEAGRPYATRMADVVASIASGVSVSPQSPKLLAGTGKDETHLIVVATGDRRRHRRPLHHRRHRRRSSRLRAVPIDPGPGAGGRADHPGRRAGQRFKA